MPQEKPPELRFITNPEGTTITIAVRTPQWIYIFRCATENLEIMTEGEIDEEFGHIEPPAEEGDTL